MESNIRKVQGYEITCRHCGHIWATFDRNVVHCPKCKNLHYTTPVRRMVKIEKAKPE
jgi:phage FluMu protein Com